MVIASLRVALKDPTDKLGSFWMPPGSYRAPRNPPVVTTFLLLCNICIKFIYPSVNLLITSSSAAEWLRQSSIDPAIRFRFPGRVNLGRLLVENFFPQLHLQNFNCVLRKCAKVRIHQTICKSLVGPYRTIVV